jgi:hypothetical protein
MIKIELTQEQFNTVLQLIDIAIKAGGYANAKVAVPVVELLLNQAENPKSEQQIEIAK